MSFAALCSKPSTACVRIVEINDANSLVYVAFTSKLMRLGIVVGLCPRFMFSDHHSIVAC